MDVDYRCNMKMKIMGARIEKGEGVVDVDLHKDISTIARM